MVVGSINIEEEELEYEIYGINMVIVYMLVVNYLVVLDDQQYNQKIKLDMS